MQSTMEESAPDAVWREVAPLLDEAMARLGATARDAVVLRYFENKSLAEVGTALGVGERAGLVDLATLLTVLKIDFKEEREWKLEKLPELYELVSRFSGMDIPVNYPITGQNAFCGLP